mgnify:FL=1
MDILLDGKTYSISGPVKRSIIQEWPSQLRTTGVLKRSDRALISTFTREDWSGGLGAKRMLADEDSRRFWDSNCETRFQGQVTPPILAQVDNIVGGAFVPSGRSLFSMAVYGNDIYAVPTGAFATTLPIMRYSVATSGWIVSESFSIAATISALGLVTLEGDEGGLWVVYKEDVNLNRSDITAQRVIPWLAAVIDYIGSLAVATLPNTLPDCKVAALKLNPDKLGILKTGQVSSRDVFVLSTIRPSTTIETNAWVPARQTFPNSMVAFPNIYGSIYPAVGLPGEVRHVQGSISQPLLKIDAWKPSDTMGMVEWQKILFIPVGDGGIYAYKSDGSVLEVGPNLDDGIPVTMLGPTTATAVSNRWLFVAMKPLNRPSVILAFDMIGWHKVWEDTVSTRTIVDMKVFAPFTTLSKYGSDSIDRLFVLFDTDVAINLPFILSNPVNTPSLSVATQGYFEDLEISGLSPEIPSGFYRMQLVGKGLSNINTITPLYGFDGASPTTGTLGIAAQNFSTLAWGNQGTQARSIQVRYLLTRGTLSATYPQLISSSIEYYKQPSLREQFEVTIDSEDTARITQRSTEMIVSEVGSLASALNLVGFQYGQIATRWVKLIVMEPQEDVLEQQPRLSTIRVGKIPIRLVEL